MNNKNIIYILGAARSGSTLLDIILGNGEGIFSAGELNRFTKRSGIPHDAVNPQKFEFWKDFREEFERAFTFNSYEDLNQMVNAYEYHNAFFKKKRKDFEIYADYNRTFFNILFEKAGSASIIIDSSKYPMRGYYLNQIFPGRIRYIYLKRNPSGVVNSFGKRNVEQPSKGWLEANLYLLSVRFIADSVCRSLKKEGCRCIEITYEDLVRSPVKTLDTISEGLQVNLGRVKELIKTRTSFSVGNLFDGNRLRKEEHIELRTRPSDEPDTLSGKITNTLHQLSENFKQ